MSAISTCRSCGSPSLVNVLSLGTTPLANSLLKGDADVSTEERFPLAVVFCEGCALVQITETVPPERLFSEYVYFSSFSDTMVKNMESLAARTVDARKLGKDALVVEIASNDGYLLQFYKRAGVPVLGIEPAANIAKVAEEKGIRTKCAFFSRALAEELSSSGARADVIHANNVLAHVPDLNGFVKGIQTLLKPDGVAIIEAPYVRDMVEHVEFDTIYHEHVFYFSLTALDACFRRQGLVIVDVEKIAIHGGSLRITAAQAGTPVGERVTRMLDEEKRLGMTGKGYYQDFAARVERLKGDLVGLLRKLRDDGKRVAAYGAAAKGSTLVNYFGIGRDLVEFVVDRSPHKQGLRMPGVHIPIKAPQALLDEKPDYVLLLAWNFADEIMAQQAEYRGRGGKFIVPVPAPRVV